MSNKRQRQSRAIQRELWREDLISLGLKEMTLGVWRWEKEGIDFYPARMRAYKYRERIWVDWEESIERLKGEKR